MENTKTQETTLDLLVKQAKFVIGREKDQEKNTNLTGFALYGLRHYCNALYDVTTSHRLHRALDDIYESASRYLRGKQDYEKTITDIDSTQKMFKAL